MTGEPFLTASDVAKLLGVSAATVLDRWEAGELPGFRLFGGERGPVRFRLSQLEAEFEKWRRGPTPRCGRQLGVVE